MLRDLESDGRSESSSWWIILSYLAIRTLVISVALQSVSEESILVRTLRHVVIVSLGGHSQQERGEEGEGWHGESDVRDQTAHWTLDCAGLTTRSPLTPRHAYHQHPVWAHLGEIKGISKLLETCNLHMVGRWGGGELYYTPRTETLNIIPDNLQWSEVRGHSVHLTVRFPMVMTRSSNDRVRYLISRSPLMTFSNAPSPSPCLDLPTIRVQQSRRPATTSLYQVWIMLVIIPIYH